MSNGEEEFPIYILPGFPSSDGWHFNTPGGEMVLSEESELIGRVLAASNGVNTQDEIIEALGEGEGADSETVHAVVRELAELGVISDRKNLFRRWYDIGGFPTPYAPTVTREEAFELAQNDPFQPEDGSTFRAEPSPLSFREPLEKRKSCRQFEDEPIELADVLAVLQAGYGADLTPVASAGGLWPLRIYVTVTNGHESLPAGHYQFDHHKNQLVQLESSVVQSAMQFAFNRMDGPNGAPVTVTVAGDISRSAAKYGNRAFPYAYIEAGSVVQNMAIASKELELDSLVRGGFNQDALSAVLGLNSQVLPLVTFSFGKRAGIEDQEDFRYPDLSSLVGPEGSVEWVHHVHFTDISGLLGRYMASAMFNDPTNEGLYDYQERFTTGQGPTARYAELVATAEAHERYMSGRLFVDTVSSARDLDAQFVNPNAILPMSDEQLNRVQRLQRFTDDLEIQWVKGSDTSSGESIFVPADVVFYPLNESILGRKPVAEADSSGVAAHTELDEAKRRATLELVERDAIMRMWYEKQTPNRISVDVLPQVLAKRTEILKGYGYDTHFLDLSNENAAISLVAIVGQNDNYPFLVTGASARTDSYASAALKAFEEAENGWAHAVTGERIEPVDPSKVHMVAEHGELYYYNNHAVFVEWMWSGRLLSDLPNISTATDIVDRVRPIIVDLSQKQQKLRVVRALSEALVPIRFGVGYEPLAHKSLGQIRNTHPHFFA